MSITNLIADTNMDLVIVDLSEDECTEKTEVKPKDGTVVIGSDQNNANNEQIDWDLLEMETDQEDVKSQKESQSGDSSLLLLEAESDALLLSSTEKGLDKIETVCLGSDVGKNGDNCQSIFVSSSKSKIGTGNDNLDLGLNVSEKSDSPLGRDENSAITDAEDKEIAEKKEEFILSGADYNEIGKEDTRVLDINENLNVDKNQSLGLDLSSHKVSEIDNKGGLNESSAPNACADNSMCLDSGEPDDNCVLKKGVNVKVLIEDAELGFAENKDKFEEVDPGKLNLEAVIVNQNAVTGDLQMNDLESAMDTSVQSTTVGANTVPGTNMDQAEYIQPSEDTANADFNLYSGSGNDFNEVKEKGVNVKVLIEDAEMGFAENKDKVEEVDSGKLNLDGVIVNQNAVTDDLEMNDLESAMDTSVQGTTIGANTVPGTNMDQAEEDSANTDFSLNSGSAMDPGKLNLDGVIVNQNAVTGDLEMNDLESSMDTGVQGTTVGANTVPGTNMDQAEHIQPSEDDANKDFNLNSGSCNDINEVKGSSEFETVTLGSLPASNPPKKRGRPRKTPGSTNVVVHNDRGSSGSWELRKRDNKSWIRKGPYVMYGVSNQIWAQREEITQGEDDEVSKRDNKKVKKAGDDGEAVSKGNARKTKFSEKMVKDLLSAAQGLLYPKNSILRKSTRGFLTSFRNSVASNEVAIAPPPVLLDARDKMEDVIMSLQGSGLEDKDGLIRDAKGLLEKVNLMLAKNSN